ncbi:MAG: HesA/MoeB/ThiF family protein [Thermoplasmatales archaeon]
MNDRYLSQLAVKEIFPSGQKKIEHGTIVVVGMGGIGTSIAEILTRMGIGKLVIIDDDYVELTNLNRQSLYGENDIGRKKVEVAARVLRSINSEVEIVPVDKRLTFENAPSLFSNADVITDATDNYDARGIINDVAFRLKKMWVFSAVEGTFGYVKAIIPGKTSCLACFGYPTSGPGISCTVQGVIGPAVKAISSIAASLAVKLLVEGDDDGALVYLDVWRKSFESMIIPKNPTCRVCGENKNSA